MMHTPAPTISVPEDTTAALVAMPEVGLSARPPTSVGPATVVINTNARWIKNLVGVTIPDGVLVSNVPSSTRQSPSAYAVPVSVSASDPTNV